MFISTSTNIHFWMPGGGWASAEECLERCRRAGFRYIDANFCEYGSADRPLTRDDWEQWCGRLRRQGDALGLRFPISHAPFYNVCEPESDPISDFYPGRERQEELVRRAIIASGMLGVKWIVFHAGQVGWDGSYDAARSLEKNLEYFRPHIELAKECGCGIAIENMGMRHYTADVENLIALVDAFNDPAVGICWDFGHANLTSQRQTDSLRRVGRRLKTTHVADNHGVTDEHIAPYHGNVPWEEILPVLREIGYEGGFNYEIHNQVRNLPLEMRDAQLKYLYELADYMVNQNISGETKA